MQTRALNAHTYTGSGWRGQGDWRVPSADVMTSEEPRVRGTVQLPCPPPVGTDRSSQGGRRGSSPAADIFSASTTAPVILPVWWMLFSTLLSWVIWGIIPKVSKHPLQRTLPGRQIVSAPQRLLFMDCTWDIR